MLIRKHLEKRTVAKVRFKQIVFFQCIFNEFLWLHFKLFFISCFILLEHTYFVIFSAYKDSILRFSYQLTRKSSNKKKAKKKKKKFRKHQIFGKFLKVCDMKIFDLVELSKFHSCEKNLFSIFSYFLKWSVPLEYFWGIMFLAIFSFMRKLRGTKDLIV